MSPRFDQPMSPGQLARQFLLPALFVGALFGAYLWRHPRDNRPAPGAMEASTPGAAEAGGAVQAEPAAEGNREYVELTGRALGTSYMVKVVGELEPHHRQAAMDAVRKELGRVDELMSTWRDDSELSRFNASTSLEPTPVSGETAVVVAAATEVFLASGGAFDVTVGPLVQRWGFGSKGRTATEPTDAELAELMAGVGQHHLVLAGGPHGPAAGGGPTLRKAIPGLQVDLSAIAKGYAVDRVHRALVDAGHGDVMVEIGGEVRVSGASPRGSAWRIGVERPSDQLRQAQALVSLKDEAMATSGDYRNFYETGGQRRSHTIDPRTGRPVQHDLAGVSVIADDCMTADAWATALNVLGPERGPELAAAQGLAAYFLVRDDGQVEGLRVVASPAWAERESDSTP